MWHNKRVKMYTNSFLENKYFEFFMVEVRHFKPNPEKLRQVQQNIVLVDS